MTFQLVSFETYLFVEASIDYLKINNFEGNEQINMGEFRKIFRTTDLEKSANTCTKVRKTFLFY